MALSAEGRRRGHELDLTRTTYGRHLDSKTTRYGYRTRKIDRKHSAAGDGLTCDERGVRGPTWVDGADLVLERFEERAR